jgi:hypothetical protein
MILGVENSKFICGETTMQLYFSLLKPNYFVSNIIEDESVINGCKEFAVKSDHSEFFNLVYLFKYDTADNTFEEKTAIEKFNDIYALRGQLGIYYPFADGAPIKDISDVNVSFYLVNVIPYSLDGETQYDIAKLIFKSQTPTNIAIGKIFIKTDPSGDTLLSESGEGIEAN